MLSRAFPTGQFESGFGLAQFAWSPTARRGPLGARLTCNRESGRPGTRLSRASASSAVTWEGVTVKTIRAVFEALGASVSITPCWQGAELDRLLDEEHALLAGRFSQVLKKYGWEVETEVSYSRYG